MTIGILVFQVSLSSKQNYKIDVCRRAIIFGGGMGRDNVHYCDVLSYTVNFSLVEGSKVFITSAGQLSSEI